MSGHLPEGDEQLSWDFENFAKGGRTPETFQDIGRLVAANLAGTINSINSVDGLELALSATLKRVKDNLSPHAQQGLLRYLMDTVPAQTADSRPNSPYFKATVECFGWQPMFDHVTAPIADLDETYRTIIDHWDSQQLSLDDEYGQAA